MQPEALTLTVLGAGPAAPNTGGACSGYLLRSGDASALVDCGSGVAGRLRQHIPPWQLRGIAISHFHADHYFDLVPLYYSLKFGRPRPAELGSRVPLYVPPGGHEHMRRFGWLVGGEETMFEDVFAIREYTAGPDHTIGGFMFTFHPVQHYVPSHAMRIAVDGGPLLVFSSDVGPCEELIADASGADLFLCEAALASASEDPKPERRGHLSAAEAGEVARAAAARRLLITHCQRDGGALDQHHRSTASAAFGRPVDLADEGKTYAV
jgi:ribonuclease BN (tRNA processing enzyme)